VKRCEIWDSGKAFLDKKEASKVIGLIALDVLHFDSILLG